MTSFPESVSGLNGLEIGLAAIRQGNYTEAVSLLEAYLDSHPQSDQPDVLKARMGLVKAYDRVGRTHDAIELCDRLSQSQHKKVRLWASQTLKKLTASSNSADETGFVPLQFSTPSKSRQSPRATQNSSLSDSQKQENLTTPEAEESVIQNQFMPTTNAWRDPLSPLKKGKQEAALVPPFSRGVRGDRESVAMNHQFGITPPSFASTSHIWRNSGRAQRWKPLSQLNPARLQWAEMGTAIALFIIVYGLWTIVSHVPIWWFNFTNRILGWRAEIPSASTPTPLILLGFIGLFVASPWLLDALLKICYGLRPLSTATLATHSSETHRMIQRFCQEQKTPIPQLGVLPTQAPLSFSYGCHPKFARIVVSQGLLEQLADDEIAVIYASELGHIKHWDFSFMSFVTIVTQIPYISYWQTATVSDWLGNRRKISKQENIVITKLFIIGATLGTIASALSYGLFWILRWSGLWLSRQRIIYSDRHACNLTGNPNGLARALMKCAIATTQIIQQQQKTDYALEGFEFLTPVGYRNALHIGSFFNRLPLSSLLQWDQTNPDRHWLSLNQTHPLMGERLSELMNHAYHWQLEPEFDLEHSPNFLPHRRKRFLLQCAPFLGTAIGYGFAQILWFTAQITYLFGHRQFNWLASDYRLFGSFMLIGFGVGTIVRFNAFFPEIREVNPESLVNFLTQPNAIPVDRYPICLEGKLLGRSGSENGFAQDLILQTETGLIKLHWLSQLGVIGNLLPKFNRLSELVGQSVAITGWFRRGAIPWIDVDTIKTNARRIHRSGHPVWSIVTASTATLIGVLLIL